MSVLATEACTNPLGCAAQALSGTVSTAASDYVLGGLGRSFLAAAEQLSVLAFASLDDSTAIDLSATWFRANVTVIAAVTLPAIVGLFVVQVITSVLRREPGGLGRAVLGVGKALLGAALALAVTQLALTAVDGICGFIAASADTTVSAAASRFFDFVIMSTSLTPGLQLIIGTLLVVGFLVLWGVLLFRKAALILVAVFAPVAFAGQTWDATRVWTRRWLEVVAALVLSKVVIVVVFVVGASAFSGLGPTTTDAETAASVPGLSDALVGLLLLTIAMFAPWLTWRFVHWGGMEAAGVMHQVVAANPVSSTARGGARAGVMVAQQAGVSAMLGSARAGVRVVPRPTAPPAQGGGQP